MLHGSMDGPNELRKGVQTTTTEDGSVSPHESGSASRHDAASNESQSAQAPLPCDIASGVPSGYEVVPNLVTSGVDGTDSDVKPGVVVEEEWGALPEHDHRRIARELELFMFSPEAPGMPFYLPKGLVVRNTLETYERGLQNAAGYEEVRTPLVMNQRLWDVSGHLDHYRENMYFLDAEDERFALKPMSCPGHMLIYKSKLRSYRDLPIRLSEYGHCHRYELSGTLTGMMRLRAFTQDDAHIFARADQIESEIERILALVDEMYAVFGFSYRVELSTRPENSMGSDELWGTAESALQAVLEYRQIRYQVNPGDGAFYGPKIDFHIRDNHGRDWQCATIQLDFQLPERFDLTYVAEDNQRRRPVVIHRAILGSVDRFLGIVTEHFNGAFPVWLAPVQVRIVPVAEDHKEQALLIQNRLQGAGIRAEIDARQETLGYRIREAQMQKIPYTFVVGDRELEGRNSVAVRRHGVGDLGTYAIHEVMGLILEEIRSKAL